MRSGYWNSNPPLKQLTDPRITHYVREGRYGEELQRRLLERETVKQRKRNTLSAAVKALKKLVYEHGNK